MFYEMVPDGHKRIGSLTKAILNTQLYFPEEGTISSPPNWSSRHHPVLWVFHVSGILSRALKYRPPLAQIHCLFDMHARLPSGIMQILLPKQTLTISTLLSTWREWTLLLASGSSPPQISQLATILLPKNTCTILFLLKNFSSKQLSNYCNYWGKIKRRKNPKTNPTFEIYCHCSIFIVLNILT